MSNTGFVDVITKPAGPDNFSVPGLGTFAPGAGPAIGLEGKVFLGTMEGKVIALHPDGSAFWNHQLPDGRQIIASPAIGSDGSVYVVGVRRPHPREHRAEFVGRNQGTLYKFRKDGGVPPLGNAVDFPEHRSAGNPESYGPRFIGAHDVWRFGNEEAILVPAAYPTVGGYDLHLLAFAPGGGRGRIVGAGSLIADATVAYWGGGDVTGEPGYTIIAPIPASFPPGIVPFPEPLPFPGVAIYTSPQGGRPWIAVSNSWHRELVAFTFLPAEGFKEVSRTRASDDAMEFYSSPTILPNMNTAVGTNKGVMFGGPSASPAAAITSLGYVYAQPTLAASNRVMIVESVFLTVLENNAVAARTNLGQSGQSMARAAASRTHVYVSMQFGLHTFDADGKTKLLTFPWTGGGISSPAIGPEGHVYAMAANVLFIFRPPRHHPLRNNVGRDLQI